MKEKELDEKKQALFTREYVEKQLEATTQELVQMQQQAYRLEGVVLYLNRLKQDFSIPSEKKDDDISVQKS